MESSIWLIIAFKRTNVWNFISINEQHVTKFTHIHTYLYSSINIQLSEGKLKGSLKVQTERYVRRCGDVINSIKREQKKKKSRLMIRNIFHIHSFDSLRVRRNGIKMPFKIKGRIRLSFKEFYNPNKCIFTILFSSLKSHEALHGRQGSNGRWREK